LFANKRGKGEEERGKFFGFNLSSLSFLSRAAPSFSLPIPLLLSPSPLSLSLPQCLAGAGAGAATFLGAAKPETATGAPPAEAALLAAMEAFWFCRVGYIPRAASSLLPAFPPALALRLALALAPVEAAFALPVE
jgi:hypothetical protein